jgi:hypothetical protein
MLPQPQEVLRELPPVLLLEPSRSLTLAPLELPDLLPTLALWLLPRLWLLLLSLAPPALLELLVRLDLDHKSGYVLTHLKAPPPEPSLLPASPLLELTPLLVSTRPQEPTLLRASTQLRVSTRLRVSTQLRASTQLLVLTPLLASTQLPPSPAVLPGSPRTEPTSLTMTTRKRPAPPASAPPSVFKLLRMPRLLH